MGKRWLKRFLITQQRPKHHYCTKGGEMNIGVGYVRVSTKGQVEDGISLAMQVEKIKAYAFLNDIDLVAIYGDPGLSGKTAIKRPGLQAVLTLARRRKISHMIVYKLDRFSRSTIDALTMSAELDRNDVSIHSITEKIDTRSAIGRFFFTILGALAEMERSLISERTKDAMRKKIRDGEKVSSRAPFGYAYENGRAVPDQNEQSAIEMIRSLKQNPEKISLRKAAAILAKAGHRDRKGQTIGVSTMFKLWNTV